MLDAPIALDRFSQQEKLWETLQQSVASHPKPEVNQLKDLTSELIAHLKESTKLANEDGAPSALPESITSAIGSLSAIQKVYIGDITALLLHLQRSGSIQVSDAQQKHESSNPFTQAIQKMKDANATVDKALNALRLPVMDNVFTAHPTFIGDLEYTKHMRRLDRKIAEGDEKAVAEELGALLDMPSIVDHPMGVAEETQMMRHFLTNAYQSVPHIYEMADEAIQSAGLFGTYDPAEIKLQLNFQSWGSSGDKDGNKNVNYHTTEDAIKTHRKTAVHFYQDDLVKLFRDSPESIRAEFIDEWAEVHNKLDQLSATPYSPSPLSVEGLFEQIRIKLPKGTPNIPDIDTELSIPDLFKQLSIELPEGSVNPSSFMSAHVPTLQQRLSALVKSVYNKLEDYPDNHVARKQALDLMRKIDTFGLAMGNIEYRETAEVNATVLDFVITPEDIKAAGVNIDAEIYRKDRVEGEKIICYSALQPEDRTKVMDAVMQTLSSDKGKDSFKTRMVGALARASRSVKSRHHHYASPEGTFYHTIKRLELAARNPDMIKNQVLAEAGSATEFKEMLALLKLTDCDEHMRIIPLFEDPLILAKTGAIMREVQTDPHLYEYLVKLSLNEWSERALKGYVPALPGPIENAIQTLPELIKSGKDPIEETQRVNDMIAADSTLQKDGMNLRLSDIVQSQVQMAHSDNSRRGGIVGARASLFKAHDDVRKSAANRHIGMQFHEGGSHTDAFRMGVRSYRSLVNTYDNHEFMKCTVQGMDLAQIFSSPTTIEHFIGENLANSALIASQKRVARGKSSAHLAKKRTPEQLLRDDTTLLEPFIDQIAHYQEQYFTNPLLGYAMEQVFEYSKNKLAGTQGSRAAGRDGKSGETVIIDQEGYVASEDVPKDAETTEIDIAAERKRAPYLDPVKGTRTIGYSETLQHGGLNPNFIGFRALRQPLLDLPHVKGIGLGMAPLLRNSKTEAQRLQVLYKGNPAVRDIVDRVAYAIAATDFEEVWYRAEYAPGSPHPDGIVYSNAVIEKDRETQKQKRVDHTNDYGQTELIERRPKVIELADNAQNTSMLGFLSGLELEYRDAARFVLEAISGKEVDLETLETSDLRAMAQNALLMYRDHFAAMDTAMGVAKSIENTRESDAELTQALGKGDNPNHDVKNALNKMVHHIRDMATLVRAPFQAEWLNRGHKQEREHAAALAV